MNLEPMQFWTFFFLLLTFGIYIYIAWRSRVKETKEFYVASQGVPTIANGAAVAADWMSAASFIGMAGLIAFLGSDGSVYLMGWTGGYVLLALLLAPYLRKWGKFTVPEFVGDRYSDTVRVVAAICAIVISFTYVVGQMTGGGVVFARFLGLESHWAVVVAAVVIFFYAVLGGMKGITYTQVAQYTVLIIAYLIPAVAVSQQIGGFPVPQVTYGTILAELDALREEFGLHHFTEAFAGRAGGQLDVFLVTMSLMIGTAGLPHVIIRFYTTKTVRGARFSAFWALFFISLLYLTAPAVGAFTKLNLLQGVQGATGEGDLPAWVEPWAETGHVQVNSDGAIDSVSNVQGAADMYVSPDILVLASPEIGGLPAPIIGLMAAGGMAAALSTAAGLLLVISSSASHDIYYRMISKEKASEKTQMLVGRLAMVGAVLVAIIAGLNPPAFVAQVVAFAFGLAASTFFPILILGIFWKRANAKGAAAGMLTGLIFSASYMIYTLPLFGLEANDHIWGISPEGIGTIGAALNFLVTIVVSNLTRPPSEEVQEMVESIRYPAKQQLEAAGKL
ncbi:sodium:solute symporter family protein [Nesterenkonia alkaliphila]|uniref:Sodium/solute symporter n=1 Tax=Nesterenkonia alkaliphila TaxID=1463631 RepID=A0A7K1UJ23_9MICC|nr:sodium:solute symporter family protein [Nesterenkonia alkaliphila]MVT26362.1 sodium/solute symporter [Nesterenkonia alkaliphila]GFZ88608.1 sodium/solute symporter [Nesterenkonia alkaliphila]